MDDGSCQGKLNCIIKSPQTGHFIGREKGNILNIVCTAPTPEVFPFFIVLMDGFSGSLKTLDTIGNCLRPVFSLAVSQHMHKITNMGNLSSIGHRSCEIIMKEKTPLSYEVVCFQILDFETSSSKSEVSKSNSRKITSFSKTKLLQREPFLTMFYTTNSSPLLITK